MIFTRYLLASILLVCSIGASTVHATGSARAACAVSSADDGERGRVRAIDLIAQAYLQGGRDNGDPRFDKLHAIVEAWSSTGCKLLDGRPKINFLLFGFDKAFDAEQDWETALERVQALREARPGIAYPVLLEAEYWLMYAWDARGGGYASSVTPEGWKRFHERLAKAERVLIENKDVASTSPNWYSLMISIVSTLDHTGKTRNEVFAEGVRRYPNFLPLYIAMRSFLEPKWGGSWDAVDDFINWSTTRTEATDGQSMYALLYYGVRDGMRPGKRFFTDTRVEWPRLKQGFQDLIRLYPESGWHLEIFSGLACEAEDEATYVDIRKRIRGDSMRPQWVAAAQRVCDARFELFE